MALKRKSDDMNVVATPLRYLMVIVLLSGGTYYAPLLYLSVEFLILSLS